MFSGKNNLLPHKSNVEKYYYINAYLALKKQQHFLHF